MTRQANPMAQGNGNGNGYRNGYISGPARSEAAAWVAVVVSVAVAFWTAVNPKGDTQATEQRVERRIESIEANMLRKDEHAEFKTAVERRLQANTDSLMRTNQRTITKDQFDTFTKAEDSRITGIGARAANAVSREEHVKDLGQVADRISSIRDGLIEFQKTYGSNYTLGDQLKAMQSQINDLQSFLRGHAANNPKTP